MERTDVERRSRATIAVSSRAVPSTMKYADDPPTSVRSAFARGADKVRSAERGGIEEPRRRARTRPRGRVDARTARDLLETRRGSTMGSHDGEHAREHRRVRAQHDRDEPVVARPSSPMAATVRNTGQSRGIQCAATIEGSPITSAIHVRRPRRSRGAISAPTRFPRSHDERDQKIHARGTTIPASSRSRTARKRWPRQGSRSCSIRSSVPGRSRARAHVTRCGRWRSASGRASGSP